MVLAVDLQCSFDWSGSRFENIGNALSHGWRSDGSIERFLGLSRSAGCVGSVRCAAALFRNDAELK